MADLMHNMEPGRRVKHSSLFESGPHLARRHRRGLILKALGIGSISIALVFLATLLVSVFGRGMPAFFQHGVVLEVEIDADVVDPQGNRELSQMRMIFTTAYQPLIGAAMEKLAAENNISTEGLDRSQLGDIVSDGFNRQIRDQVLGDPSIVGSIMQLEVPLSSTFDRVLKGQIAREGDRLPPSTTQEQIDFARAMDDAGAFDRDFNWGFITGTLSADASKAGIGASIMGSLYMMLIVLVLALIFGVAASIYLEEFARKNAFTDFIEVNISNLAAVPSIVFGILGAAIMFFFNSIGIGLRGTTILGGLVLSLMTLPTIVISTRAALKAVPPSIRDAALGVGASKIQTVFHHVLPLAMPGILTGTIIGLAQALGETAPLLLIGLVGATAVEHLSAPWAGGLTEPAGSLPTAVYMFATDADSAFRDQLAPGAIIVMLLFLLAMNIIAILLRRRFERRW